MSKLLSTALSLSLAGVTPAFADDAHHPDGAEAPVVLAATRTPGASAQPAPAAATPQLLENARQLQEEALGIARAKTDTERQRLLQQHLQTLRAGMLLSNGMMTGSRALPRMAAGPNGATGSGGPGGSSGRMGPGMTGPGTMGPGMMGPGTMGHGMMGPGMMGGGMMGGGMMGPHMAGPDGLLSALDLSDDQQRRIDAIHDGVRKQHWELMGRIMDERAKLRDLYRTDKRDPSAIGAEYQRIFDLRRQMIETGIAAHNRLEEVLTAEQRQRVRDAMRRGYGAGMMGG